MTQQSSAGFSAPYAHNQQQFAPMMMPFPNPMPQQSQQLDQTRIIKDISEAL